MYDEVYNTRVGFIEPPEHIPSDDDMKRYAAGDRSIVSELIEGLIGFVTNEVDWFLRQNETASPYKEDCLSEGLLALTVFVNTNLGKTYSSTQFLSYAKEACLGQIVDWLREMSITVTMPARTQQHRGEKPQAVDLKDFADGSCVFEEVWFKEFLSLLTDEEEQIVQMKIQGLSNREIAKVVGIDDTTVRDRLDSIYNLFCGEPR